MTISTDGDNCQKKIDNCKDIALYKLGVNLNDTTNLSNHISFS
jgi:hypothetical protein